MWKGVETQYLHHAVFETRFKCTSIIVSLWCENANRNLLLPSPIIVFLEFALTPLHVALPTAQRTVWSLDAGRDEPG